MTTHKPKGISFPELREGRDELNLADFPISVLQWQQPRKADGAKVQTITYKSTRYDSVTRRRVPQQVTLSSEEGLPTSSDERMVLALLCIGKRTNDFADPKVAFYPNQLLRILRWPANVQHYRRLRDAMRRLTALTIRYENAWYDVEGRQYEQEFATGIIASYQLARLSRGRKNGAEVPLSWVEWRPAFFRSLQKGSLKRLNLDDVFSLRLPIAQRMYRFLDKRFYGSPTIEFDLLDFACGHIGVTRTGNIAELKRRLWPAILELESIGFIKPANTTRRFLKLGRGVWRVRFERAARGHSATQPNVPVTTTLPPQYGIVQLWHLHWTGATSVTPTSSELACAKDLIEQYGLPVLQDIVPLLAERMKQKWPDAKTFGAVKSYVAEVATELEQQDRLRKTRMETSSWQDAGQQAIARQQFQAHWQPVWERLSEEQRTAIRLAALTRYPGFVDAPNLLQRECLEELARREDNR